MARVAELRARYRAEAAARGVNPRDVDVLLADVTGRSTAWLFAHGDEAVDPAPLEALLSRRFAGEPLQYVRGRADFFGREFAVDHRVLIPRPETELLVEAAIERAPRGASLVDIGTGSGCIAISIERSRPDLCVLAVDASPAALAVAAANARTHGSAIRLVASDILTAIRKPFDVIVSNPPYIPAADLAELAVEVRDHEPRGALTPGPAGTEAIERIFAAAGRAMVMLEIGFGQEAAVRGVAAAHGFSVREVLPDLAGIPRVVVSSPHGWK